MDDQNAAEVIPSEQPEAASATGLNLSEMQTHAEMIPQTVRYASDEMVRQASEKVFRVHSRLLSELAK